MLTKILPSRLPLSGPIAKVGATIPITKRPHIPPPVPRENLSARIAQSRLRVRLIQYFKQGDTVEHPISRPCTPREYLALLRSLANPARPNIHHPNRQVAVERVLHLFRAEARHQRRSRQETRVPVPPQLALCYNNLAWVDPFPRRVHKGTQKSRETSTVRSNQQETIESPRHLRMAKDIFPGRTIHAPWDTIINPLTNTSSLPRVWDGEEIDRAGVNALLTHESILEQKSPSCPKSISTPCNNQYP